MTPADFAREMLALRLVGGFLLLIALVLFVWILALERDFKKLQRRIGDLEYQKAEKIFLPERLRPRWWW